MISKKLKMYRSMKGQSSLKIWAVLGVSVLLVLILLLVLSLRSGPLAGEAVSITHLQANCDSGAICYKTGGILFDQATVNPGDQIVIRLVAGVTGDVIAANVNLEYDPTYLTFEGYVPIGNNWNFETAMSSGNQIEYAAMFNDFANAISDPSGVELVDLRFKLINTTPIDYTFNFSTISAEVLDSSNTDLTATVNLEEVAFTVVPSTAAAAASAEICGDVALLDEDLDGNANCLDTDCIGDVACPLLQLSPELLCTDGVDNDLNGFTDCDDVTCIGTMSCPVEICDDPTSVDEDADGFANCDDSECSTHTACTGTPAVSNTVEITVTTTTDVATPVTSMVTGTDYLITLEVTAISSNLASHLLIGQVKQVASGVQSFYSQSMPGLTIGNTETVRFTFSPTVDGTFTIDTFVWSNWLDLDGDILLPSVGENYESSSTS